MSKNKTQGSEMNWLKGLIIAGGGILLAASVLAGIGFNSRIDVLEAKVPEIKKNHEKAQDHIHTELNYIRDRVDKIHDFVRGD